MRGLLVETANNLILAGPHRADIYDPTTTEIRNLGTNFYFIEHHVGNTLRAVASVDKLRELNPYKKVDVLHDAISEDTRKNYDLVIVTELFHTIEELWRLNEASRAARKGFILWQALGVYGYAFIDYGDEFMILDETGKDIKSFIVTSIDNGEEPIVTVHEDKKHSFHDDSYVKFTEI